MGIKNKSGIYCWINKLNLKFYIGSGNKLNIRINSYFNPSTLIKNNRAINSGILKYGLINFMLVILEFTEPVELIEREQPYIDTLNPPYNILKRASSILGFKHSALTRKRLREVKLGKTLSEETLKNDCYKKLWKLKS
uniref:GIY-YIG endonuclease n=1 Tax=Agaricus bitorquis TaxID=5343 RepID=UPI00279A4DE8|nr:GIY-YIG endonuclease [Agaricus bitorquis]WFG54031.1 GIY-YIG endonuclease [Agaricus bitorquis]